MCASKAVKAEVLSQEATEIKDESETGVKQEPNEMGFEKSGSRQTNRTPIIGNDARK